MSQNSHGMHLNAQEKKSRPQQNLSSEQKKGLLAKRLKQKMKAENIKGTNLAGKLGRSPSEISKWLSGNHNFTIETLFSLEEELGISLVNIEPEYKPVVNGSRKFNSIRQIRSKDSKTVIDKIIDIDNKRKITDQRKYKIINTHIIEN